MSFSFSGYMLLSYFDEKYSTYPGIHAIECEIIFAQISLSVHIATHGMLFRKSSHCFPSSSSSSDASIAANEVELAIHAEIPEHSK